MRRNSTEQSEGSEILSEELTWTYIPLPSQGRFGSLRGRFKGFSGPVGSGKSAALGFETLRQSFVNRGRQGLLAAPTFAMLRDATLTGLFRLLDEQEVQFE
ncbi:MAG TPA: hypothetical protein VGE93_11725, partial [Bryobacteraceae bacterium]